MTKELKKVLIMAGGTGGHVFPGLAVANYLVEKGIKVEWLGTENGLEARLVPAANLPFHVINIAGVRRKDFKTLLMAPFKIFYALIQASNIIKKIRPDVVIGMGGFVSGPGGFASWLLRHPLIIHEQNAKPGFTNQLLSKLAYRTLEGFPATFKTKKGVSVGNPVRTEIESLPAPNLRFGEPRSKFRLLVLGGSLGAQALNELIPNTLADLDEADRPEVIHQTGEKHYAVTKEIYEARGVRVQLQPFITQMGKVYSWADMVICRAGALTVSELCSAGLGAILIPFPYAVDDHQTANANFMVKNAAAFCFQQKSLTHEQLATLLKELGRSPEKRLAMANAAYALRQENVVEKIFAILAEAANKFNRK